MGGGGPVELEKGKQGETVFDRAMKRAMRGGVTGAAAQGVNVLTLMWLRTTMNFQMANGGTMIETIRKLHAEGGIPRFYRGLVPALIGSPISRFGDTFANAGALAATEALDIPIFLKTALASVAAGGMRIFLMPIDAWKTNKQVHGESGLKGLMDKARAVPNRGPQNLFGYSVLWHGGLAAASATAVGHWPWFVTYNYLNKYLGWNKPEDGHMKKVARNASIGLAASFVSDVSSNSIRVLKTYRQTAKTPVGYVTAAKEIIAKDGLLGWNGLMFRGLQTRIVSHGINSAVFTVAWNLFKDM